MYPSITIKASLASQPYFSRDAIIYQVTGVDKTVYFEVASISRVSCGGRQTALITQLRMQAVLQSYEYASKA